MKRIAKLESKLSVLRDELSKCTDPEDHGNINEQIDFIQDEIDELESEVDPENIYGILSHQDSPSLDTSLNY